MQHPSRTGCQLLWDTSPASLVLVQRIQLVRYGLKVAVCLQVSESIRIYTDTSRPCFQSSSSTWWVRMDVGSFMVLGETVWMAQVRSSESCAVACRADPCHGLLQLAVAFRVVSTRRVRRSLCHPSSTIPHCIRNHGHCFRRIRRPRHLSTSPSRLRGLLAWLLDMARSLRRHARFPHVWDILHRVHRCRQHFRGLNRPRRFSMPPVRPPPADLSGLYLDLVGFCRRRARS